MSIRQTSKNTWDHEFSVGYHNDEHEIEVTKEGINIHCDFLSWEEIDEARRIVTANAERMHPHENQ